MMVDILRMTLVANLALFVRFGNAETKPEKKLASLRENSPLSALIPKLAEGVEEEKKSIKMLRQEYEPGNGLQIPRKYPLQVNLTTYTKYFEKQFGFFGQKLKDLTEVVNGLKNLIEEEMQKLEPAIPVSEIIDESETLEPVIPVASPGTDQ